MTDKLKLVVLSVEFQTIRLSFQASLASNSDKCRGQLI